MPPTERGGPAAYVPEPVRLPVEPGDPRPKSYDVCACGWVRSLHPREGCDGFRNPQSWSIIIRGWGVRVDDREKAREMALATVKDLLGGDTKLAARMLDRIGFAIDVVPDEQPDRGPLRPAALRWEIDPERADGR